MTRKIALIIGAVLLLAIGSGTTYLAFSVPNDIRAEAILREARDRLTKGERDAAREKLRAVVDQYPRTDAGSTAINILFTMADQDRATLLGEIEELRKERERDRKELAALAGSLSETNRQTAAAAADAAAAKELAQQKPKVIIQRSTPKPTPKRASRRR